MASNGSTIRVALDLVAQTSGLSSLSNLAYALSSLANTSSSLSSSADLVSSALRRQDIAAQGVAAAIDRQDAAGRKVAITQLQQDAAGQRVVQALTKQQNASDDLATAETNLNGLIQGQGYLYTDQELKAIAAAQAKVTLAQRTKDVADAQVQEAQTAEQVATIRVQEAQAIENVASAHTRDAQAAYDAATANIADAQAAQDAAAAQQAAADSLNTYMAVALAAAATALAFDAALKTVIEDASHLQYTSAQMDLALHGTQAQIDTLNPKIIEWADNSLYTTAQVHQLVQALSEHGLDVSSILNGDGQAAITLGEAMGAAPVDAANLLGSTLQIFSSQGLDATTASNVLTAAFYNGVPSATELQTALEDAGGQAATMGVSLTDLTATIDLLAQAGMPASSSALSLRYMLQSLADPTTKAATDMNYLGLTIVNRTSPAVEKLRSQLYGAGVTAATTAADGFDGTSVGLNNMFKEAQKLNLIPLNETFNAWAIQSGAMSSSLFDAKGKFIGLGDAMSQIIAAVQQKAGGNQQLETTLIGDMFNVRSGRAAEILAQMTDFKGKYNAILDEMGKTSATADAEKLLGTLQGSMAKLTTTLTSFGAAIGDVLLPPLTHLVDMVNTFVGGLMKAHPQLMTFIGLFLIIGAIISTVVAVVVALAVVFMVVAAVVGGTIIVVFGIVIVVIIIVAALAALIIMNWGKLGAFFGMLGQHIGAFFSGLGTWAHNAVAAVGNWFSWLGTQLNAHWNQITSTIAAVWAAIPLLFQAGLQTVENWVKSGLATVVGWFSWLYNHNYYFQELVDFIRNAWTTIKKDAQDLWNGITGWLSTQWDIISQGATNRWNQITGNVGDTMNKLGTRLHDAIYGITGLFSLGWTILSTDAKTGWDNFTRMISNALAPVNQKTQSIIDGIKDIVTGLATSMYTWGENAIGMLVKSFDDGVQRVKDSATRLAKGVAGILGFHSPPPEGPLADSDTYMPNMMRMYAQGITAHTPLLSSAISNAANTARFALTQGMAPQGLLLGGGPGGVAGGGNQTVNVSIGNQQLFSLMMNHLTGQMQINGLGRAFK